MRSRTEAARSNRHCPAPVTVHVFQRRTAQIIPDYERGALLGGILIAVSFGIMFVVGAWFGWL